MRKLNFTFLLAMLTFMGGGKSLAHDIEVANADGVTIYYNFTNNQTELAVTYKGSSSGKADYAGKVVIPESVTYEGNTYSVTSIRGFAFQDCSSLTEVTIPGSVTSIGEWAFSGCSSLTEVTIPGSVTSIGSSAFRNCSGLTEVTIPSSVTSIGDGAFEYCSGLTEVTIPGSVTSIGGVAFYKCSGLTEVTIGNGVISIGSSAFNGCSGLTKMTIPSSVTSIGADVFYGCSGLTTLYSLNTIPPTAMNQWGYGAFDNSHYATVDVFVPAEALEAYQTADIWKYFQKWHGISGTTAIAKVTAAEQIQTANGQVTVTGLTDGTTVAVYDLSGKQVGTATSKGGQVNISTGMTAGAAAIVKVGERSVKTVMK